MARKTQLRDEQAQIIHGYDGGRMGIAAVPGSGKTFTLSHLAARLIQEMAAEGGPEALKRREVLVVTFTNSAVNSFRSRIADILGQRRGLLPYIGYRVRTLHGLAHDIVRERPGLVGLAEDFQIVDERVATRIISDVVYSLLPHYQPVFAGYINPETVYNEKTRRRVESKDIPDLAVSLGLRFIKQVKNRSLSPDELRLRLQQANAELPLLEFGLAVYEDYQRSLGYRGAVDFDDLVRLAIMALETDKRYLSRLRRRWPYILEDEAQDSSLLQERMLEQLSNNKNWVRVGDPNQAINTTFTTADPVFLRQFLEMRGVTRQVLSISGRSTQPIIDLANALVTWTAHAHPVRELRDSFLPQVIQPTPPDDPQPNPLAEEAFLHIHYTPGENVSPDRELEMVAASLERFVEEHAEYTVAALVPENSRGIKLAEQLTQRKVPFEELLRSTSATREAASVIHWVLAYLSEPLNARALARVYRDVWCRSRLCTLDVENGLAEVEVALRALSGTRQIEQFLWPERASGDLVEAAQALDDHPAAQADLDAFRRLVRRWLSALILPVDQLVLTLSQDLFTDPADIALGHKIAGLLRSFARNNPTWRLPEYAEELRAISENRRKFIGFDDVEQGYDPEPGRVTIATMHAAKGLEWDRVYLLGVSNYGFPSAQPNDNYVAERWFIRDRLNLEAESMAQLNALMDSAAYREGVDSESARLDYAEERLRLLYVGITRARRDLIITWNMGRFWERGGDFVNRPALPMIALWDVWKQSDGSRGGR